MAEKDYGTIVEYVGDGFTRVYPVPFPSYDADDVCIDVDGSPAAFTRNLGMGTLVLDTAPAVGHKILIFRATDVTDAKHKFADKYVLKQDELDETFTQFVAKAQELDDKIEEINTETELSWNNVTGKPTEFPPEAHQHTESDITDLDKYTQAEIDFALSGKTGEAPIDGNQYARKDAGWEQVVAGGGDVEEAPNDGKQYGRQSEAWTEITGGGGGGASAPSEVLIEEVDVASGEFNFQNIPAGFDRLVVRGYFRGTTAAAAITPRAYLNGDMTTANYRTQRNWGFTGSPLGDAQPWPEVAFGPASTAPAGQVCSFTLTIENPDHATNVKQMLTDFSARWDGTNGQARGQNGIDSSVTAPVTSLLIQADTGTLSGRAQLFGQKAVSLEASNTVTTKILVATITDPVSGEFDFDLSDYQDGDRVVIAGALRSTVASTFDDVNIYINEDTTNSNYLTQMSGATNGANISSEFVEPVVKYVTGASSPSNAYAAFSAKLEDYSGSGLKLVKASSQMYHASGEAHTAEHAIGSAITAPVTRLRIRTDNHATDTLTGTLSCYIEKQGVVPVTPSGGRTEIQSITDPVSGEFDFQNIPQGYKRLRIKGDVRSALAGTQDQLMSYANGDTTAANYHRQNNVAQAGAAVVNGGDNAFAAICPGAGSPMGAYCSVDITVSNYASTSRYTNVMSVFGGLLDTSVSVAGQRAATWKNTAAVTEMLLKSLTSAVLSGTLTLYGEN